MKKSILLFLLLSAACFTCRAQGYYKWAGAVYNAMVYTPADKAMVTDQNSNVYTIGTFSSNADFNMSSGTAILSSAGSTDIFIARYDSLGNYIWAKKIGAAGSDKGASIAIDAACNIYITGEFQNTVDFDPGAGTSNLTAIGTDIFLAKYDSLGNLIWAKSMSSNSSTASAGYSLCFDHSGKLILAGKYAGTVDFDPSAGGANMNSNGGFIAKYDTAGTYIWAKTIGNNLCVSVSCDQWDDVYVTGIFNGSADFDPDAGTANLTAAGIDIFVAAYNSAGNYVWAFRIGNTATFDHDYATSIVADSVGNVYVSGIFNAGNADFDPGPGTANLFGGFFSSDNSIFVAKYNSAGDYNWAFRTGLGGIFVGDGGFLNLAPDGNLFVTAAHGSDVDLDPGPATVNYTSQGSGDIFIAKYTPAGGYLESFSIGGPYIERPYGIVPDHHGNVFLMGNFASYMDFDPTTNVVMLDGGGGGGSMVIAKYGACTPVNITSHPVSDTVCPGSNVTYSTSATGDGLVYQWQCNTGSGFANVTDDGFYFTGATTATLNVMHIGASTNVAQYQCLISGSCSSPVACNPADLVVLQLPVVNSQSMATSVCRGGDTLLFVNASGSGLTYQWQYNYGTGYYPLINDAHYSGVTDDTLRFTNVQFNGYTYRCMITGVCGTTTYSFGAPIYINEPPVIGAWASSNPVCAGFPLTLHGSGATTYSWSGGVTDGVPFIPTTSDTYTLTGTDNHNCQDTMSIHISVVTMPDNTTTLNTYTLTANQNGASYQWVNCNNNFQAIPGATSQSYAGPTGNYAVIINNGCIDTSQCETISITALQNPVDEESGISIYPNPVSNLLTIEFKELTANATVEISNMLGQVVYLDTTTHLINSVDVSSVSKGCYFVKISLAQRHFIQRLLIE